MLVTKTIRHPSGPLAQAATGIALGDGLFKKRDMRGDRNPNWKGGRVVHKKGYIMVRLLGHHRANPNGYVMEHIIVAEEKIGRRLEKGEQVHHIDHNKANNHPDNLAVMTASEHYYIHHGHKKGKSIRARKQGVRLPRKVREIAVAESKIKKCLDKREWPDDSVLLEMAKTMSSREISRHLGNVSNVAVWRRLKLMGCRLTGKPLGCYPSIAGPNPAAPALSEDHD